MTYYVPASLAKVPPEPMGEARESERERQRGKRQGRGRGKRKGEEKNEQRRKQERGKENAVVGSKISRNSRDQPYIVY